MVIIGGALKESPGAGSFGKSIPASNVTRIISLNGFGRGMIVTGNPGWTTWTNRRELLLLISAFDRPISLQELEYAVRGDSLPGLTSHIADLKEDALLKLLEELESTHLVAMSSASGSPSVSTHPLVQQHFYRKATLELPQSVQALHRRLFYYYSNRPISESPTRQELEPLYVAVFHGARGNLDEEAFKLYFDSIQRGLQLYAAHRLGALSSNLNALGHFFSERWGSVRTTYPLRSSLDLQRRGALSRTGVAAGRLFRPAHRGADRLGESWPAEKRGDGSGHVVHECYGGRAP